MLIQISQLTSTFLRRNMVHFVSLHFSHTLTKLKPAAVRLVFLSSCMSAATPETVMLDFYIILSLLKGKSYFFSSKDIPIKVLTENLSSLVSYLILWIDHDTILSSCFKENSTNDLRIATIDEYQFWHAFSPVQKNLSDFVSCYFIQGPNVELRVVFEFQFSVFGTMTDDV